jgi:hypothetical protein
VRAATGVDLLAAAASAVAAAAARPAAAAARPAAARQERDGVSRAAPPPAPERRAMGEGE